MCRGDDAGEVLERGRSRPRGPEALRFKESAGECQLNPQGETADHSDYLLSGSNVWAPTLALSTK